MVTGANIHDSQVFDQLLEQVIEKVWKPNAIAVDAGYKTPAICENVCWNEEIRPVMPYTRPNNKRRVL